MKFSAQFLDLVIRNSIPQSGLGCPRDFSLFNGLSTLQQEIAWWWWFSRFFNALTTTHLQVHYSAGHDGYVILNKEELPEELPFSICNQSPPNVQVYSTYDFDHHWKSNFLSVDSLSHNLPSKLHTQLTLAAMSPGMLVTQVRKIGFIVYNNLLYATRWLYGSVCFLTCPNTCSSPPPCCRPSCPAKCARNVGDSCAPSTTLRELNFLSFNNGYDFTIIRRCI